MMSGTAKMKQLAEHNLSEKKILLYWNEDLNKSKIRAKNRKRIREGIGLLNLFRFIG